MKVINVKKLSDDELVAVMNKADFTMAQRKKLQTRIITDKILDLTLGGRKETIRFINEDVKKNEVKKNTDKLQEDIQG